jgi:hypothetical protein
MSLYTDAKVAVGWQKKNFIHFVGNAKKCCIIVMSK